ncbi:hypothetical protein AgCh_021327 [Apium graveolens]
MLLAARALTHLCDVLPTSCATVVHYGVVSAFVDKLLTIEYIDLAEQISEKVKSHPVVVSVLTTLEDLTPKWKIVPTKDVIEAAFKDPIKIMIAALSFLLNYENIEDDDNDDSSSEDESTPQHQVVLSK